MTITRRQRNSEMNDQPQPSNVPSERSALLTTCQNLFAKELTDEESLFWVEFTNRYSLAELRYAFDNWSRNGRFFPKPKDIGDLAESYRMSVAAKQFPIGCHRCKWSGVYTVSGEGTADRRVAFCPCRKDPTLREPYIEHYGQGYGSNDMIWLFKRMELEVAAGRKIDSEALLAELDRKREGGKPAWR